MNWTKEKTRINELLKNISQAVHTLIERGAHELLC